MLTRQVGMWLRQQREARGWARRDMARRLIQAAQAAGDTTVPGTDSMCTYIRRWEHGHYEPTERYKLYYCAALSIPPAQFGKAPPGPSLSTAAAGRLPATTTVAYRGTYAPEIGDSVEREVLMTAHESSDHAEQAEQPGIGDVTFEQLRADVVRLARLTDTGEPFVAFLEMRRVRDRMYRLLDRRLWPREQTDLYFLLGCINGLMGVNAQRLGYPDAAEELIRAGCAYADAIDHRPLRGQLLQQLAYVAYWRGRFEECRDLATSGLEYLSQGPLAAQLHLFYARATGAALADIRGAESAAAEQLERAIGLYDAGPGSHESYSFSCKPLASIDLAVIRLRSGALEAAAIAFEPVWALPSALRISTITTRLAAAREELAAPIFRGSPQARALGEQIEEFGRETIVAGLHSLPGGPG
jgi:transcriptional regulator with XRE-family HTH domain